MCGTCHVNADPRFPSALVYDFAPDGCLDCHAKLANPDISWVEGLDKLTKIAGITLPEEGEFLRSVLAAEMKRTLRKAGAPSSPEDVYFELETAVDVRRLRETRFVPAGYFVCAAEISLVLRRPGRGEALFERRARSRPEYSRDEKEAAALAVSDAWRVITPFLLEAMGSH